MLEKYKLHVYICVGLNIGITLLHNFIELHNNQYSWSNARSLTETLAQCDSRQDHPEPLSIKKRQSKNIKERLKHQYRTNS